MFTHHTLRSSSAKLFGSMVALVLALSFALSVAAAPASSGKDKLSKHDHELLATAQAQGRATVTLLIAATPGANKTIASGIAGLGGTVRYRDDDVSYIRAIVPTAKAEAAAQLSGIQSINLDEVIPLDDPAPEASGDSVDAPPAPGVGTPNTNPYMPTQDIGAPQFVAAHPTWDGRGVTVGIVDTGVDLAHPALQTTTTGERKIVDWVTGTDPFDDGDPTWINMQAQVSGASFSYMSVTYTAPAAGTYRIGLFNEAALGAGSEYDTGSGSDINRDGDAADTFAVLWDATSNNVWVDTNQNHSFADDQAMTDYAVHYDIGYFGTDNPATAVAERVPFVVQTDGKNKFVNIGIVSGEHGTHVAGIVAANGLFGGPMNGAAPGAKIKALRACMFVSGCTAHALVEGMIRVAKQMNVDVINMSIGGLPALNDGNNTRATIYNRLIEQYNVQMFISAGNSYAGINTVGDPSVATNVMSVGAYVSKDTFLANYDATVTKNDGLFTFSSRGPREDGGFKPNIVAPGSAVSSIPTWEGQGCLAYVCQNGYAMLNGTSMAAPQSTGGAALLISAAKQSNVQYQPAQLRQAINSSARFLSSYDAYEQGNGLFQVGAAWNLLKTNIKTVSISSKAPVNTVLKSFLAIPGYGPGIYEREGLQPGDSGSRTISFTRTTGGSKAVTYNVSWVGNDGSFSSASSISLPLNTPVNLTVNFGPLTAGAHSAILNLDDPSTTGVDYQVLNTLVAAYQFNAANNFSVSQAGGVDRADTTSFFYNVPANTPALKIDLTGINGRIRFLRYHPYGVSIDSTSLAFQTGGSQSRTVSNPAPGVWEVMIEASRTAVPASSTFTITASILGVDITPAVWTIDPATVGTAYNQSFSFTNRFGAFTGGAVGTALGSALTARPTIAAGGAQQTYTVNVPAGSTSISARIGNASDQSADLDLFLFDCHTGPCVLKSSSTSGSAEESVSSANPAAGTWVVLVDPFAVPSGSTAYDYIDVVANPAFGSVSITDPAALHANGATWSAPASVTPASAPSASRFLQGFVRVTSGSSVLGSAEVDLKNVAP